jgi:hypothetical protein
MNKDMPHEVQREVILDAALSQRNAVCLKASSVSTLPVRMTFEKLSTSYGPNVFRPGW